MLSYDKELMMNRLAISSLIVTCFFMGCDDRYKTNLTPGAAKKNIQIGCTTQAEVIEVFGSPNIVTKNAQGEVWVYDKISSRSTSAAFGIGGGGGGAGSGGGGGGLAGGGFGSSERSETTVMLIIYFNDQDIVRDYRIKQTKF
jgi:outer membrane protein assembly factor BamE (lipoprotein component of BamABCDE complex)